MREGPPAPAVRPLNPCPPPALPRAAWVLNVAGQVETSVDMFLMVAAVLNSLCIHGMTTDKMDQQKERKAK